MYFLGTDWKKVEPILNLKYATYDEKFCYPPIGGHILES